RNRITVGGNITLPHGIGLSPLLIASSGRPFNILLGQDLNGDSVFNDRPAFAAPGVVPALATTYGDFDLDPLPGQSVIPANYGSGPAQFTMNLRVSKTFGFGEATGRSSGRSDAAGGPPPGGDEGPGPGAGPFGMGGRGGRPPRGGLSSENAHRYNLTLS